MCLEYEGEWSDIRPSWSLAPDSVVGAQVGPRVGAPQLAALVAGAGV